MNPRSARPGQLIGGCFRIEREVGAGGMGTVYRARDEQTGRAVAVKLFDVRGAVEVKRAYQETQLLARLKHPAIVAHIADGITDAGQLYLVMEWIEGVTLDERLGTARFTIDEVVALGRRIAHALGAAHELGVVHRDVKPTNVLLPRDRADAAILIDFGIARVADAGLKLTRTGITIGTPGYMAPEQARGIREITPACDVFSLGCVLYQCLTARPPFVGASLAATLAKIVFSEPDPIHRYRPDAPTALVELIGQMMKREIALRLQDGNAVAAALDTIDLEPPPLPPPPPPPNMLPSHVHCMVIATNVQETPPSDEQVAAVRLLAQRSDARAEILESHHVCVHLEGERKQTVHRAASLALAMRGILAGWMIGISSEHADAGAAAETGTELLTRSSFAALFRGLPSDAIVADPQTRIELEPVFELADHGDYEAFEIRGVKTMS